MATNRKRILAALNLRKLGTIGSFIEKMRVIALNMANNPTIFPSPTPSISTFSADIADLENAEDKARTHEIGKVAERNLQYDLVLRDMNSLKAYVQSLADNAANEEEAIAIITASGLNVKNKGVRVKPDLSVRNTDESGTVKLIAKSAGKIAVYEWKISNDMTNWTALPGTLRADTMVKELIPGSKMYFRYRAILKRKTTDWSQIVTLIIT